MTFITINNATECIDTTYIYSKKNSDVRIWLLQTATQNIELLYGTYDQAVYYKNSEYADCTAVVLCITALPDWCDNYVILADYVNDDDKF